MLLIAVLAYSMPQQVDGIAKAISILWILAFGAQRLLPILQQTYGSCAQINSGLASLKDTLELLPDSLIYQPLCHSIKASFFGNLDFRMGSNHPMFSINLTSLSSKEVALVLSGLPVAIKPPCSIS